MLKPNPGQAFNPVRVVIFGHQFGPFPDPPNLMEPATYGFRRDLDTMFGLERRRQGGTTPAGAAPAVGTRGFFENGSQRARQPRHQDRRLHSDGELPLL